MADETKYEDFPKIDEKRLAEEPEAPPAQVTVDVGNPAQIRELLLHKLMQFDEDRQRIRYGLSDENMGPMKSTAATRDILLTTLANLEALMLGNLCVVDLISNLPGILQTIVLQTLQQVGVIKPAGKPQTSGRIVVPGMNMRRIG